MKARLQNKRKTIQLREKGYTYSEIRTFIRKK
jgi:hypothetical protein